MKPAAKVPLLVVLVGGVAWFIVYGILNGGLVRNAGWPYDLADLEGEWVLDHVRGDFALEPPGSLRFLTGTAPDLIQVVADGDRVAEFRIRGTGLLEFVPGSELAPLLADGATATHTMTHTCPPVPQWDHFVFFPDGPPLGRDPKRRSVTYERE